MSEIKDEILAASGGLNYDDDPRLFGAGDTDYRLNMIPTSLGSEFVLTNLKGTTTKTHGFSHSNTYVGAQYTTIGSCYDIKRNAVYFFIYSNLSNHCILRYNIEDDDFDKIVWDNTQIGLDTTYPITDAFVMDDWLFWNPRGSSPRAINVDWAYYDYVKTIYDGDGFITIHVGDYVVENGKRYLCIKETVDDIDVPTSPDFFQFDGWCYDDLNNLGNFRRERNFINTTIVITDPPVIEVTSDASYQYNNIKGKSFQFCYRWYIPEQGYSISSPFSEQAHFYTGEQYNGELVGDETFQNQLNVHVPLYTDSGTTYPLDSLFEYLEILFRNSDNDEWRVAATIPHDDVFTNLSYYAGRYNSKFEFKNNSQYVITDRSVIEVPYNYVPITAKSQCSIDGDRVGYGGVIEGRNPTEADVTLTAETSEVDLTNDESGAMAQEITMTASIVVTSETSPDGWVDYKTTYTQTSETITLGGSPVPAVNDIIVITVDGIEYRSTLTATGDDSASDYADFLVVALNNIPRSMNAFYKAAGPIVKADNVLGDIDYVIKRYSSSVTSSTLLKYRSFKTGAWHSFCLFYYDSLMRRSEAIPLDPVYVESPAELQASIANGTNHRRVIKYEIDNLPPQWASKWRFGYAGNVSIGEFWQYNITGANYISSNTSKYEGLSYVDITTIQDLKTEAGTSSQIAYPNTKIESYVYQEGDRIRFITRKDAAAAAYDELDIDDWSSASHDYEVISFDTATNYLYFDSDGLIGDGTGGTTDYNGTSVIVEIYRNRPSYEDAIYYEVGGLLGTYTSDGVLYHRGSTVDQTASVSADGYLYNGDAYLIARVLGTEPAGFTFYSPVFLESYSISDFKDDSGWGKGKYGATFDIDQKDLNIIRYSNKLSKNRRSSSISTFDALDYLPVSYNYGDISSMRQIGGVLSVLFANNVASVLVGATQMYNDDGTSQVLKSDNVLGSINYSEEEYGCVNPESVLVVDRSLYFFDLTRKCYVRKAPNGMVSVSDYKMKKYFIDKCNAIISGGKTNAQVYSAWDDDRGLLYVSIQDIGTESINDVVIFHEDSNRWVAFSDMDAIKGVSKGTELPDDASVGSSPDFALDNTFSSNKNTVEITASDTGSGEIATSYFDSFTGIPVTSGDKVYITAYYVTGGDSGVYTNVGLAWFLDGVKQGEVAEGVLQTTHEGVANAYSTTLSITSSEDLTVKFFMDGNTSCTAGDAASFVLYVSVGERVSPMLLGTPSDMIGFSGENLYLHDDSSTRCNFYGVQKEYTARIYGLIHPNIIKEFDSMAIHTNKYFDVTDVKIPATLNYPNGMQSLIPEARFEKEEGVLRSNYLCNQKTNQASATVMDLHNGDTLRGYIIYQDLDGDETVEHNLYKVDILSTPSKH